MLCKVFQAYDARSLETMINAWMVQVKPVVKQMQYAVLKNGHVTTEHFVIVLYDQE